MLRQRRIPITDYSLGRAHGQIEIDYSGDGADKAARDLDKVAASSEATDKSLTKTQKTLRNTERSMGSAGNSAEGYRARLRDVEAASRGVEAAERDHRRTLLDSKATLSEIKDAEDRVTESRKRHTAAVSAQRDAHVALSEGMSVSARAASALAAIIPSIAEHFGTAAGKSNILTEALGGVSDAALKLGSPELAAGLEGVAGGVGKIGGAVSLLAGVGGAIGTAAKDLGSFELAFGKISGLTLAIPSLAGLAGIGGGTAAQGILDVVGSVKQLSGVLGLLPAVISAVELSTQTLEIAFHGVDSALKDMMSDDPKKFLADIKDMAPLAAQAMLDIAQFRDGFKGAGAAIQDSFFAQIVNDIKPLIQTWLPAVTTGMTEISGAFGEAAHQLAGLLQQPGLMNAFTYFVDRTADGIKALEPAMVPLINVFSQLVTVGSSFFGQVGDKLSGAVTAIAGFVNQAAQTGQLKDWIQGGVDAFEHLANIAANVGDIFLTIMNSAEKFGAGGLLTGLEKITGLFDDWTKTVDGQKTISSTMELLRSAADAFLPLLSPLADGLSTVAGMFTRLGVAIAPGWSEVFHAFSGSMEQLAPQLVGMAPALNQFLDGIGSTMRKLVTTIGPQLPTIFEMLSNAFVALLPQLPQLLSMFTALAENVGPQLPKLFDTVTMAMQQLTPLMPLVIEFTRELVSGFTWLVATVSGTISEVTSAFKSIGEWLGSIPGEFSKMGDAVAEFFEKLPQRAEQWGISLVRGLVTGMLDSAGLGSLDGAAKQLVDQIAKWFQSSPAKVGPFSGEGYTLIRGRKMVTDMAAGMASAQSSIEAAASSTAAAASGALTAGSAGGAPSPGGSGTAGQALLPDNIAGADTGILTAYLRHQFSDTFGLKGLAKDLGGIVQLAQGGFNLVSQNVMQPLFQALGMLPGAKDQAWRKMTPQELASAQQATAQKDEAKKGPSWNDVLGSPAGAPSGGVGNFPWDKVAAAESSGNWQNADTGGNGHYGGLQFSPATWAAFGGLAFAPRPDQATREQQIEIANRTAFTGFNGTKPQGLGAWETITKGMVPGVTVNTKPDGVSGSSWQQLVGSSSTGTAAAGTGVPIAANPASRASTLGGASANYTPATMAAAGIAPLFTKSAPGSMAGAPAWVSQLASTFGLTATSHQDTTLHGGTGQMGDWAFDFSGAVPDMQRFADFIKTNLASQTLQAIWQNPTTGQQLGIAGGQVVGPGQYYTTPGGTYADHTDHVHWATDVAPVFNGALPPGQAGMGSGINSGLVLPSGKTLDSIAGNTATTATTNDKLLQSYLQGNPALAQQIDAAKTPGAPDATVMDTLTGITSTINDLKAQDAVGNKNTIDALQNQQQQLAQQQGFTQGPNQLQQAQTISSSIASGVSGIFQTISSGLDALAGTQDIADRLVYGVRNTEDINKIIDDVQKYIKYASDLIGTIGSLVSAAGSFTGGSDFGGTSAAGSALSLVSSVLAGVNAAIDYGQQVYEITMGYVGKFVSVLTGLGGTDLMGNVGFLLDTNSGQLRSYSMDNPQQQDVSKVPSWMSTWYQHGPGNPNPQVNQQLNVYAGPGQSPAEMMNETMWMVNTSRNDGCVVTREFLIKINSLRSIKINSWLRGKPPAEAGGWPTLA